MKVGANVTMINPSGRPDDEVYQDELSLIDLVEPLGFDSLMCVEHHFTGFAMIPNNTQLLAYVAGRTKRIQLVTDVIVLPWHDPIRVAEEIATLDVLSGGRTIFGFGRGAAPVEYEGFGIPMEQSRERFKEAAEIVIKGITQERFSYHGKHFNIPEISIRPRPVSHPERRFYAASISPQDQPKYGQAGLRSFHHRPEGLGQRARRPRPLSRDRAQRGTETASSNVHLQRPGRRGSCRNLG